MFQFCILALSILFPNTHGLDIKADAFAVPVHKLEFSSLEPPADLQLIPVKLKNENLKCWIQPQEEPKKNEEVEEEPENLLELALEAVSNMPCLQWDLGFWKYEYCHKKGLTQFHQIPEKGVVLSYDLGNTLLHTELVTINDTHTFVFPSITLGKGTICDVNGEPRTSEIHFQCKQDAHDHISKVSEVSTCRYVTVIYTSKLCRVSSKFLPRTVVEERIITCYGSSVDGDLQSFFDQEPKEEPKQDFNFEEDNSSQGDLLELAKKLLEKNGFSLEMINLED